MESLSRGVVIIAKICRGQLREHGFGMRFFYKLILMPVSSYFWPCSVKQSMLFNATVRGLHLYPFKVTAIEDL